MKIEIECTPEEAKALIPGLLQNASTVEAKGLDEILQVIRDYPERSKLPAELPEDCGLILEVGVAIVRQRKSASGLAFAYRLTTNVWVVFGLQADWETSGLQEAELPTHLPEGCGVALKERARILDLKESAGWQSFMLSTGVSVEVEEPAP